MVGIVIVITAGGWLVKTRILNPDTLYRHSIIESRKTLSRTQVDKIGKFTSNVLSFPNRLKDSRSQYGSDLYKVSGFGVQFFVFGTLAYILAIPLCIFKKEYRNSILGFLIIFSLLLLTGYFFYYYSFFSYRLYMFFPVIGLISWAFILTKMNIKNYFLIYIDVLILVMLLFNAAVCFYEGHTDAHKWKTSFTITNRFDRTTVKHSSFIKGEAWEFIDNYIPPDQAIGYYGGINSWIFPYFDNQLKRKIFFLGKLPGFRSQRRNSRRILSFTADFMESLKQRNIRYIHLNPLGIKRKNRLHIPGSENNKDVSKVAENLYYVKW
jgi:hypothetical protein